MKQEKSQTKAQSKYFSLKCGLSSLISTTISVSVVQPLQLIKIRLQSHDGQKNSRNIVPKYNGIQNAMRQIVKREGFLGLYKGLSVTVFSAAISSSLFFTLYEKRKKQLLNQRKDSQQYSQEIKLIMEAAVESGALVICFTQPLWVIKTRMALNTENTTTQSSNLIFTFKQIYEQHSFKGFYKGFSMNFLLSFNRAFQMFFYQGSRKVYEMFRIPESGLKQKNFICGGAAQLGNLLIIYPLTTMRTRAIQNQYVEGQTRRPKYKNVVEVIMKTLNKEGVRGFYKGMSANIMRSIPERSIFFYCYQLLKKMLIEQSN